jgi:hypothetical protein
MARTFHYRWCPRPNPILNACCLSAPPVRFIFLEIVARSVLAFECAFSSRMSSFDHGRRISFRFEVRFVSLAMFIFSLCGRTGHILDNEKINQFVRAATSLAELQSGMRDYSVNH